MALTLRKTFSFANTKLRRYQWNAIKNFSAETQSQLHRPPPPHSAVFEKLKAEYGKPLAFKVLFQENPELNGVNYSQWTKFFQFMNSYDYSVDEVLSMINDCPELIKMPEDELRKIFEAWYEQLKILDHRQAKLLLFNHPQYLLVKPLDLRKRIHFLTHFVEKNKKTLTIMLLQCPNVMFDHQKQLEEKINYLLVNWRFTPIEIARCMALNHPIDFLKLRMTLIDKCGLYKMPYPYLWKKKKIELMKLKKQNPHLKHLTDTEDEDFAENIAKITIEEYEVYKILFEETLQAELESDEEIDYDETDL